MGCTLVAGVDTSTQSCPVVLRRFADGKVVGEARVAYPQTTPPRNEQDAASWSDTPLGALKQLQSQLRQTFADLSGEPVWIATFGEVAAAGAGVQAAATLSGPPTSAIRLSFSGAVWVPPPFSGIFTG
jgi:sugar (pentulose or hexulose) kinase